VADIGGFQPKVADNMSDTHDSILQILQQLGKPAALADVKARSDVPERTISRWLTQLVASGQVLAEGQKRGRRYYLPPQTIAAVAPSSSAHPFFSTTAFHLIQHVRQPLMMRDPCTYNAAWLASYQPNQTFYLPAGHRQLLMQQGRQVSAELPAGTYAQRIFNRLLIGLRGKPRPSGRGG
jgi:hypothetical protein